MVEDMLVLCDLPILSISFHHNDFSHTDNSPVPQYFVKSVSFKILQLYEQCEFLEYMKITTPLLCNFFPLQLITASFSFFSFALFSTHLSVIFFKILQNHCGTSFNYFLYVQTTSSFFFNPLESTLDSSLVVQMTFWDILTELFCVGSPVS